MTSEFKQTEKVVGFMKMISWSLMSFPINQLLVSMAVHFSY